MTGEAFGWRAVRAAAFALGSVLMLAHAVATAVAAEKISFWVVRDPQNATQIALANRLGYFKDAGLDVDLHWVTTFTDLYAPVGAESVDFTVTTFNNALKWHQDNVPMRYIAVVTDIAGGQGVAINPAVVKQPSDFEKIKIKIAMSTGASVEDAIREFCKAYNLDFAKLQFVNLQAPDQLSALANGQVQAIAVWQPWLYRATTEFGAKMYFTGRESFIPGATGKVSWLFLPSGVLASTKILKERPQAAQAVIKAVLRAQSFLLEQPDKAAALIASDLKVSQKMMTALMPYNTYMSTIDDAVKGGFTTVQDDMIRQKILRSKTEMISMFDFGPLRNVAPQLIQIKEASR
jgi:NitT/TauT family transport system substrate-binding protein